MFERSNPEFWQRCDREIPEAQGSHHPLLSHIYAVSRFINSNKWNVHF